MANSKTSFGKKWSAGCLALFALPFAAVGVGMAGWSAYLVMQHTAMRSWVEAPATITSAELKHGDETDRAVATYEYEFGGRKYTGQRVSIYGGSDNIGSFQRDAFNELKRHQDLGQPFRCYVDPKKPSESVLYRNLRGEMLAFYAMFATLFGSAGFGLTAGGIAAARRAPATLKDVPADQPWLARSDWATGLIRESGGGAAPALLAMALWWNLAALPLYSQLGAGLRQGQSWWLWLTLLFPLIGALLVIALAYQLTRERKFGESVLQLASTPGVVGGQLAGVVRITKPVTAANGFTLNLTCVETTSSGDSTREDVLSQQERIAIEPMRDDIAGATALPVLFAIPFDGVETSRPNAARNVEWRLDVSAEMPGVDYKSRFEVPVFKTGESRADFVLDERLSADFGATPSNDFLLAQAGIFKEPLAGGGVRLVFPAARHWAGAIVATILLAVCFGGTWGIWQAGAPVGFALFFFAFGLIALWVALDLWLYRSVLHVTPAELTVRSGWLGLGRRHFPAGEIREFDTADHMTSGVKVWKSIVVVPRSGGRKRTIAKGISSKLALDAVLAELNAALGRRED